MPDPISLSGLILKRVGVIKSLNDFAGKYKQAKIIFLPMVQEVDTIELAWTKIKEWVENGAVTDTQLVGRLDRSLECGTLVITALQHDLSVYSSSVNSLSITALESGLE